MGMPWTRSAHCGCFHFILPDSVLISGLISQIQTYIWYLISAMLSFNSKPLSHSSPNCVLLPSIIDSVKFRMDHSLTDILTPLALLHLSGRLTIHFSPKFSITIIQHAFKDHYCLVSENSGFQFLLWVSSSYQLFPTSLHFFIIVISQFFCLSFCKTSKMTLNFAQLTLVYQITSL